MRGRILKNSREKKTDFLLSLVVIVIFQLIFAGAHAYAQSTDQKVSVPEGFRNIELGMNIDEVKKLLMQDPYFKYRGDPDVSILPEPNRKLIECEGYTFIERAFFQFHEGKLYLMTLFLNPEEIDYYTMYTSLKKKYGDETRLSPSDAVWENDTNRLSLERPLSIKYMDRVVFEKLKEAGVAEESYEELLKDKFVEEF